VVLDDSVGMSQRYFDLFFPLSLRYFDHSFPLIREKHGSG
jgi:hypothetical protein